MGATSKQSENERRTPAVERGSDLKTKQTHVTFGLRGHKRKGSERSKARAHRETVDGPMRSSRPVIRQRTPNRVHTPAQSRVFPNVG